MKREALLALVLTCFGVCIDAELASAESPPTQVVIRYELPSSLNPEPVEARVSVLAGDRSRVATSQVLRWDPEVDHAEATFELDPGTWVVRLEGDHVWAPDVAMRLVGTQPEVVHSVTIWERSLLVGRLQPSPQVEGLPETLMGQLTPTGLLEGTESSSYPFVTECPIDEGLQFRCAVPRFPFDLRLTAPGFIPRYRWDLHPGEHPVDVGTVRLAVGGSLTGRVETELGSIPEAAQTRIRLLPRTASGAASRQTRAAVREARPDRNGFFQLEGLAPGHYTLEVEHPDFAAARLSPIEISPQAEAVLAAPVVLYLPFSLVVAVDPTVDADGRPWRVEVSKLLAGSGDLDGAPVYQGVTPQEGPLELPGQSPGTYAALVKDSDGAVFWNRPDITVSGAADAHIAIDLELVKVRGRLLYRDEPLAATLWFGGRGAPGTRGFVVDEEGYFEGVLPRSGTWRVEISADDPPLQGFHRVLVPEASEGIANVEIEIPDTVVTGLVVDSSGAGVPSAQVGVDAAGDSLTVRTGDDGRFEVRGMPTGKLRFLATARIDGREHTSRVEEVEATDGQPQGPVVLQVLGTESMSGQVVSDFGPVSGAFLLAMPLGIGGGVGTQARTGLDGRFSLDLTQNAHRFHLMVMAPGSAFKSFEVDPRYGRSVTLRVPRVGGTLAVDVPIGQETLLAERWGLRIEVDGRPLSKGLLYNWALSRGGRVDWQTGLVFPELASGTYRACLFDAVLSGPETLAGARCAEGFLAENSRLELVIPEAQRSGSEE